MRILFGLAAAVPATAHGACPTTRATTADLVAALDEVKLAYTNVDPDAFRAAAEQARALVPCLSDAVGHHMAAELHRAEGLAAFEVVGRDAVGVGRGLGEQEEKAAGGEEGHHQEERPDGEPDAQHPDPRGRAVRARSTRTVSSE